MKRNIWILSVIAVVAGCQEASVCDRAAAHVEDCLGVAAHPAEACDGARAEAILDQSCEQLQASEADGKGDFLSFMCEAFGIFCPPYEPCADKSCGDTCTICDPNDPDCFEDAVVKMCNANGSCEAAVPQCYEPCADKSCGDTCTICDPNDPNCFETAVVKMCNASGSCEAAVPQCSATCCDLADHPGFFGNPGCSEGASCCADGTWECNNLLGNSLCETDGETCDAPLCGGFLGLGCPSADLDCVEDPFDGCDPQSGGADCPGICLGL